MRYRAKRIVGSIISCTAFAICSPVLAADETNIARDSLDKADIPTLETVIVTAERRPEPLQKIPVSITALTGDDIEKSKIGSIIDVQQHVPGLDRKSTRLN